MTDSTCPDSFCRHRNRVTGHCEYPGPCIAITAVYEKETRKMPEGLTKMGYDDLISRIVNRMVQTPDDMTVDTLNAWLTGYAQCQFDILKIVGQLRDQYGR